LLQIKKKSKIILCKYNLTFLFRNKKLAKQYISKKVTPHFITLRAPKNFNIGKYKIFSLNYKTPNLSFSFDKNIMTQTIILNPSLLMSSLTKCIKTNPTLYVNSIRVTIKSLFKLMWLVVLYSF
jgi:hypothetical protein